jgi:hypothetical protein
MHDKVAQPGKRRDLTGPDPKQPNWEDVCRILGITPDIVRVWRMRTAANTDIRHLLGEEERRKQKQEKARAATAAEVLRQLQLLVTAVLNGEDEAAEAIAAALAERYEF